MKTITTLEKNTTQKQFLELHKIFLDVRKQCVSDGIEDNSKAMFEKLNDNFAGHNATDCLFDLYYKQILTTITFDAQTGKIKLHCEGIFLNPENTDDEIQIDLKPKNVKAKYPTFKDLDFEKGIAVSRNKLIRMVTNHLENEETFLNIDIANFYDDSLEMFNCSDFHGIRTVDIFEETQCGCVMLAIGCWGDMKTSVKLIDLEDDIEEQVSELIKEYWGSNFGNYKTDKVALFANKGTVK